MPITIGQQRVMQRKAIARALALEEMSRSRFTAHSLPIGWQPLRADGRHAVRLIGSYFLGLGREDREEEVALVPRELIIEAATALGFANEATVGVYQCHFL